MYLKDFQDSVNFIFGLNVFDPNFDVLNNPYVMIRGSRIDHRSDELTGFHITKHDLELEICTKE